MHTLWSEILGRVALLLLQAVVISALVLLHRCAPAILRWFNRHTTYKERAVLPANRSGGFSLCRVGLCVAAGAGQAQPRLAVRIQRGRANGISVTANELRAVIEQAVQDAKQLVTAPTSQGAVHRERLHHRTGHGCGGAQIAGLASTSAAAGVSISGCPRIDFHRRGTTSRIVSCDPAC